MGFWIGRNVSALPCHWLRRRRWRSGRRGWRHSDTAWTNNDYSYHVERQGRPRNSIHNYGDDCCEQCAVWNGHVLRFRYFGQWGTSRQRSSADGRRVHQQHWYSPNNGHIQRGHSQSDIDIFGVDAGPYRNDRNSHPGKHRRKRSLHSSYRRGAIGAATSASCVDQKSSSPVQRETT